MIAVATSDFASLDLGFTAHAGSPRPGPSPGGRSLIAATRGWTPAWAFWILSALVVAGAHLDHRAAQPDLGAVMSLVATFFGLAGLYATLSAHFLAAIQVLGLCRRNHGALRVRHHGV
jgi:hypothetical protein